MSIYFGSTGFIELKRDALNSEIASVYITLPNWYDIETGSKKLEF